MNTGFPGFSYVPPVCFGFKMMGCKWSGNIVEYRKEMKQKEVSAYETGIFDCVGQRGHW